MGHINNNKQQQPHDYFLSNDPASLILNIETQLINTNDNIQKTNQCILGCYFVTGNPGQNINYMTNDPILFGATNFTLEAINEIFKTIIIYSKKDDLLSEFIVFHCVGHVSMQMCLHYVVVVISRFV